MQVFGASNALMPIVLIVEIIAGHVPAWKVLSKYHFEVT